jgi:hypothetical protein
MARAEQVVRAKSNVSSMALWLDDTMAVKVLAWVVRLSAVKLL